MSSMIDIETKRGGVEERSEATTTTTTTPLLSQLGCTLFRDLTTEQRLTLTKETKLPWLLNPHEELTLTQDQASELDSRTLLFQRFDEATIFQILDQAHPRSLDRFVALAIYHRQHMAKKLFARCRELIIQDFDSQTGRKRKDYAGERYADLALGNDKLSRDFRRQELAEFFELAYPDPSTSTTAEELQQRLYVRYWMKRSQWGYHPEIQHLLLKKLPLSLWLEMIEWSDLTVAAYANVITKLCRRVRTDMLFIAHKFALLTLLTGLNFDHLFEDDSDSSDSSDSSDDRSVEDTRSRRDGGDRDPITSSATPSNPTNPTLPFG